MEELHTNDFRYCCVGCGKEIKRHETMTALVDLVLDGAGSYGNLKLYVGREWLDRFVARTEKNGYQWLTLEEVVEIAYNENNRRFLVKPAADAKDAISQFRDAESRKKNADDEVARLLEEENTKKQKERKERKRSEEDKGEDNGGFLLGFLNETWADEDPADDTKADNPQEEVTPQELPEEVTLYLPGFSDYQLKQLLENFDKNTGSEQNICFCKVRTDDQFGYQFRLYGAGRVERAGDGWVCPECHEQILKYAFERKQILIGMVGYSSEGKTCLATSLVQKMISSGGVLSIPERLKAKYIRELEKFCSGVSPNKTLLEGVNTINPSVLFNNVLWTYVDISGEAIYDINSRTFHPNSLLLKFTSTLHCDCYIFCTSAQKFAEDKTGGIPDTFCAFLNYPYQETKRRPPILLTLTKEDEEMDTNMRVNYDTLYIGDRYLTVYKKEYRRFYKVGMQGLIDTIGRRNYITPVTCSAFGFKPADPKEDFTSDESAPSEIEFYREPCPRNLDVIINWVEMTCGLSRISDDSGRIKCNELVRTSAHLSETECIAIVSLFCNPNKIDVTRYELIGGGLPQRIKLRALEKKAEKGFSEDELLGRLEF